MTNNIDTAKATRSVHFYAACWNYGIGCTDGRGNDLCYIKVFDTRAERDAYVECNGFRDGHSFAECVDSAYARRVMQRVVIATFGERLDAVNDLPEFVGCVHRMSMAELVGNYLMICA